MSVITTLLLVCLVTPAFADDKAKAAEHYRQGKVFENAKAYDKAIAEFEQAYALDHVAAHLFNIGLAYELVPDLKSALDYFQRYLTAVPTGPKAAEARTRIKTDTQRLLDEDVKRRDEATRIAAEQKKLKDEQDATAKKTTVVAQLKQAEAYAQAGAWVKAGEEYRAVVAIDGDPQHLLDAADAFHKQPDDVRAREALLAYLEKVPVGETSDKIRIRVAELTKSIEKAETDRAAAEHQRLAALDAAKVGVVATAQGSTRHTSLRFELRGGFYAPQSPFMQTVKNEPGLALGAGAFVDFPLLKASHIHLGLRLRTFNSSYSSGDCGAIPRCPTEISATHVGPAVTLEPSIIHRGRLDVHPIVGFSLGFMAGVGKVSFADGTDEKLANVFSPLAEPEAGIGFRYGSLSLDLVVQVSLNRLTDRLDLGSTAGFMFVVGWGR